MALVLRRGLDYPDLDAAEYDDCSFFTLLYHEGYLTRAGTEGELREQFLIPNCEVLACFADKIYAYFRRRAVQANPSFSSFIAALLQGERNSVEDGLNWLFTHYLDMQAAAGRLHARCRVPIPEDRAADTLQKKVAEHYRSSRELGYHAFTQGVLSLFNGGGIAALRMEHSLGTGRADISFEGLGAGSGIACLLEFKVARGMSDEALDEAAAQGLTQSRENGCAQALLESNPALHTVYSYGIGCRAKSCRVRVEAVRRS